MKPDKGGLVVGRIVELVGNEAAAAAVVLMAGRTVLCVLTIVGHSADGHV